MVLPPCFALTEWSLEIPNFFKGYVNSFAHWNTLLSEYEIKRISSLDNKLLTDKTYKSSKSLKTYYDANHIKHYKLVDLSKNGNDGEIVTESFDSDLLIINLSK